MIKNYYKNLLPYLFVFFSILLGIRVVDVFLNLNDRPVGKHIDSKRYYPDLNKSIRVIHDEDYKINTRGENTLIVVADSFGEGVKCGNKNNIAGCLIRKEGLHVVNLSEAGKGPAMYLNKLSDYINIQRSIYPKLSGETVHFILYSNDIVIDKDMCVFINENENKFNILKTEEKGYIKKLCQQKISNNVETNYTTNLQSISRKIFGNYSILLIREALMQFQVAMNLNSRIGRASYISKWGNPSTERKAISQVIVASEKFCLKNNCNIIFSIFPNVEDISKTSNVYNGYQSFINYIKEDYAITINNGYIPFLEKGIRNSSYSFTDKHSNCDGYKLYADWLTSLGEKPSP